MGVLWPQYLVQPPFELPPIAGPSDCLVPVNVGTAASGDRQHPLHSSCSRSPRLHPLWVVNGQLSIVSEHRLCDLDLTFHQARAFVASLGPWLQRATCIRIGQPC